MSEYKSEYKQVKKLQVGFIIFILFLVVSPAAAVFCGQHAGSGCGSGGSQKPGAYMGPAPSCNMCACFCGWFECCVPPGTGGPHLAFLWDGVNCGCPKSADWLSTLQNLSGKQFPSTPEGIKEFAQMWQDKVTWQWGGSFDPNTGIGSCGGWTAYAYQQTGGGIIPTASGEQYAMGVEMPMEQVPPGSAIVIPGHSGFYVGDGWVLHNNSFTGGLAYDRIETFYWSDKVRVIPPGAGKK